MANNIEWGHASTPPRLLSEQDVLDLTQDEDETAGTCALTIGSDGSMLLYGQPLQLEAWLRAALDEVAEPARKAVNARIKQLRKESGQPKCEHEWVLTEDGYTRTWSTTIDEETGSVTAVFTGASDFTEEGSGVYLQCCLCSRTKALPWDHAIDYQ